MWLGYLLNSSGVAFGGENSYGNSRGSKGSVVQGWESEWGGWEGERDSFNSIDDNSKISISCFLKDSDPIFKIVKI